MGKKFTRVLAVFVTMMLVVSVFAACGNKAATEDTAKAGGSTAAAGTAANANDLSKQEFVTLKILYPGDLQKRMAEFLDNEFKKKMKDELNLGVDISYSPWDQYWNKKDMMIAANEQIDWFWDGGPNLSGVVRKSSCKPIDELLNKYGQDIKKVIPAENFKAFMIDGKLMAIPSQYSSTSEKLRSLLIRKDIMDEVGVKEIKTTADIEKLAELVKAKYPDMKIIGAENTMALSREFSKMNFSYDANNTIAVDEDTKKAYDIYETEGWKLAAKKMKEWTSKGYVPEDVTLKLKEVTSRMDSGKYLISEGAITRPLERINDLRKNAPKGELVEFLLAPEKPKYKSMSSSEAIFISATAKYPERAMQMLNWMYKSKENYLFCLYGVEGKDYKVENGRIIPINTDSLWYEWMFRNANYMMFPNTVNDSFINSYKKWDEGAKLSCHFGFVFDPTPVKAEEARIGTVTTEKFLPMATGYLDIDKNYDAALKALKAAGIDKYVAEYQRQLDEFLAKQK